MTYQYPLKEYRLGLLFGAAYGSVLSKLLGNTHKGVDLFAIGSRNVYPMAAGTVVAAVQTKGDCGGLVDITYDNGIRSRYCHLEDIKVSTGVTVKKDTVVGIEGATGTTYPRGTRHLHWVAWRNGVLIDPLSLVEKPDNLLNRVNALFRDIWKRQPAPGESGYFQARVVHDPITKEPDLVNKLKYWHSVVYPGGTYSLVGDVRWQYEKRKWLGK